MTLILNSFSQSEDEHGRPARKRVSVRFGKDVRSDVSRLVSLFLIIIPLQLSLALVFSTLFSLQPLGTDKENLFDSQELFKLVIISFIPITYTFDSMVIL